MSLIKHNIGASIRAARKHRGLTQEALAKKLKIERYYLSALENDKQTQSTAMLKRISDKLEMPIAFILILGLDQDCFKKKQKTRFTVIQETLKSIVENLYS